MAHQCGIRLAGCVEAKRHRHVRRIPAWEKVGNTQINRFCCAMNMRWVCNEYAMSMQSVIRMHWVCNEHAMRMQWVRCIYMFQTSSIRIHYALNAGQSIVKKRTRVSEANPKHILCRMNHRIMQSRLAESNDQFGLQVIWEVPEALQVSVDGLRSANDFRLAVICLAIILHSWCTNIAGTRRISGISISKCLEVLSQDCTIGVWVLGCELLLQRSER